MTETPPNYRLGTLAVHAGQEPEPITGAIMPPIFQTSTYVQPGLDQDWPYDYARVSNPTRETLERNVAALEGAEHGVAFSSGLAAIECVSKLFSAGDHIISEENTYGGTTRLFTRVLSRLGLEFSFVDARDPDQLSEAVRPNTRLIHVETPTNPMMRLCDIGAAAEIAHGAGALLCVDNTFATPVNQRPHALGADLTAHSTTKYLNGHSDIIGGMLTTTDAGLDERLALHPQVHGKRTGPHGLLVVLAGHEDPTGAHAGPQRQRDGGGALPGGTSGRRESVLPGGRIAPAARSRDAPNDRIHGHGIGRASVCRRGAPARRRHEDLRSGRELGGVESLISVPALMTHASVPLERRSEMGVTERLVRLSVGIEDEDDLLEDLEGALRPAAG